MENKDIVAVVGLGYVGLPLALAFAEKGPAIGFDISEEKLSLYRQGIDPTCEAGDEAIRKTTLHFTSHPEELQKASFIIIAVPTPITSDDLPDLTAVKTASQTVGQQLTKGTIVCYESTVYPGVTRRICAPILEQESKLQCGRDFKVAYSPERINPGDKEHRLKNICKIVSATDGDALEKVAALYGSIIEAPIYKAPDLEVAEAAKLIENAQRDVNIAFMNEVSLAFHHMGIDTQEVIKAMNTKWNALHFYPGLVGGHCIGVDPYYFIYDARRSGYRTRLADASREINNSMAAFVAHSTVEAMVRTDLRVRQAKVCLFGLTFKENCPDLRNSKAFDIVDELLSYDMDVHLVDPYVSRGQLPEKYDRLLLPLSEVKGQDVLVFVVPHREFAALSLENLASRYQDGLAPKVLIDVKAMYDRRQCEAAGFYYWSL